MKNFVRRLILTCMTLSRRKPMPVPYGLVDVAEVQPLQFSLESFTGQKHRKRSWWRR